MFWPSSKKADEIFKALCDSSVCWKLGGLLSLASGLRWAHGDISYMGSAQGNVNNHTCLEWERKGGHILKNKTKKKWSLKGRNVKSTSPGTVPEFFRRSSSEVLKIFFSPEEDLTKGFWWGFLTFNMPCGWRSKDFGGNSYFQGTKFPLSL